MLVPEGAKWPAFSIFWYLEKEHIQAHTSLSSVSAHIPDGKTVTKLS